MNALKINTPDHRHHNVLFRHAISLGLKTALFMASYELLLHFTHSDTVEGFRFMKYLILFAAIGYGTYEARHWIRPDYKANDSMVFGLLLSAFTALGAIVFDLIVSTFNYHLEISDTFLPIDDPFKFAVNAMATFWACLIMGFISTFTFVNLYKRL